MTRYKAAWLLNSYCGLEAESFSYLEEDGVTTEQLQSFHSLGVERNDGVIVIDGLQKGKERQTEVRRAVRGGWKGSV